MKPAFACLLSSILLAGILLPMASAGSSRAARPEISASRMIGADHQARLEINDLGMRVGNNGLFASDPMSFDGGLEFPLGSGRQVAFSAGPWITGRASGAVRTAIAEFRTEWVPGPITGGVATVDTLRFRVYRMTRGDTTGRAAWLALAAPMGAPLDTFGEPRAVGDQTLWTVFNDAHGLPSAVTGSPRTPIGVETRLTAYAFDRPGVLRTTVFLSLQLIQRGPAVLDSAAIGIFLDPRVSTTALRAASDTIRGMGYTYPAADVAGAEAVAVGVLWLGGPEAGIPAARLRPSSFVVYPNGTDPSSAQQFDQTLRGLLPYGAVMIDSSTGQPTTFFSSGDPVTGTGWVATMPPHPHTVLAAQPFTFAPGGTQEIDIAIVIGHGPTRAAAILDLRSAATEALLAFQSDFASLPPPDPNPGPNPAAGQIIVYPNPAPFGARIAFRVAGASERVEAQVYDVRGRRVRRLYDETRTFGRQFIEWDGLDNAGARVGAGLYFVHLRVGGRAHTARVTLLSGQ